jgi:Ca2+-transporting ATPase
MAGTWYQLGAADVAERWETDLTEGLPEAEAKRRSEKYGPNELVERAGRTPARILWEQLSGVLTVILIAAAVVSFFLGVLGLGDMIDAFVILAIVVLNAALGFTQELKAERSIAALKRMAVPAVRVRRGGQVSEISARDLVPGDLVLLETGNVVPADGRVTRSVNLRVQEAALTGESEAVDKEEDLVFEMPKPLGDRRNMVYMGTTVNYGHGEIVVTETAMETELGHIAGMIQSVDVEQTPLQKRLDHVGKMLALAALAIVGVIFILGLARGEEWKTLFLTGVSLAVAAVPEAMTAVVTIALSLGAQRMLKRRALIRKLPAVETLGSVSVICTDKTGTLTENRMTVTVIDVANHTLTVSQRYGTRADEFVTEEGEPPDARIRPTLDLLLVAGALCSDAVIRTDDRARGVFRALGDPTEGALVLAAAKFGLRKGELDEAFPRVGEVPFDSERKRMTTLHRAPQTAEAVPAGLLPVWERRPSAQAPPPYVAFTKGAIASVLEISREVWVEDRAEPMDDAARQRIEEAHDAMAADGMRVLAVALRVWDERPADDSAESLEQDLVFLGLFGLMDPPRAEVKDAVLKCRAAGIRPVMITGDHPLTARHIADQVGIDDDGRFLTGQEIDGRSPDELEQAGRDVSVFARVSPEHKLKLIQAYQSTGQIVSMTGDGVNDAPALKKADIGVAMGITGTDVSKEASDMILLDDNFATIVAAVEEGRVIYDNVRKFIKYLLSCNASEILVMFFAPFLGMPLPLLPLQILWINLVTDGLPALALGVEPAEKNVMHRPPYSATESIFGRGMGAFIITAGLAMSVMALGVGFGAWYLDRESWQTLLFTTLVFSQLAVALSVRSESSPILAIGLLSNRPMLFALLSTMVLQMIVVYVPFFQPLLDTKPLSAGELAVVLGVSAAVFALVEVLKLATRRRARS